jgi:Cof subfamily protein (haloacid dehalogenase superfamily)
VADHPIPQSSILDPQSFPARLLALDIDGTLVNSRDELTPLTAAAVRRAAAAGIRVVLVTGRQYSRALPLARELGLDAPIVSSCGSLIKRPSDHATLFRAEFPRDVLMEVLTVVHGAGYDAVVYTDTYADGYEYHYPTAPPRQQELAQFIRLNADIGRHAIDLVSAPPDGVFAGFAIGARDEMFAMRDALHARLPGKLYIHVLRSPRYVGHMCEIALDGMTKWSGILRAASEWRIAREEICAVGDDVNDLPMIEAAGLGVAMANAPEEVKATAAWIAPSNDEDGLVALVDKLIGSREGT